MSEKTVFVIFEPFVSRVLGVYSDEERARNRIRELMARKLFMKQTFVVVNWIRILTFLEDG
jgi:hypothetical protein